MSTTVKTAKPAFTKLVLRNHQGTVTRNVSTAEPRAASLEEIPVIDLAVIGGSLQDRQAIAVKVKEAATASGFFYVSNHGINDAIIKTAAFQCRSFFQTQPREVKHAVRKELSANYNGYSAIGQVHVSPTESVDNKESFQWRYDPRYDPTHSASSLSSIPDEILAEIRGEEFVWAGTKHIPDFKSASIAYWQECLALARHLIRIFALALDLDENYFDRLVTYPGADGVYNWYPGKTPAEAAVAKDVGLGSHTDLQCFTLLWQDSIGGLQVLTRDGEWIKATPIPGTFVVNIGDFLQRVSNDRFVSTVHRVFSRAQEDRISMPFFFGFNFNEKVGVLDSCIGNGEIAKYEPMSCGEWVQTGFSQSDTSKDHWKKAIAEAQAANLAKSG
ncbi:hypothetical protein G6011_10309 [Alternaria panax]|uniref:Fe2OG dioxygenase domain-containing protein n=1 Tax=Alternaria panax TaxID=48097 RepID=A0AAD4NRQ9_9PLEO|nr:hypothetical protein G6011_10309 [Alternaria panax]